MHKVVTSSIDPQIDIATHPADGTICIGKEETLPFHVGRLTQKPQQRTMQMRRLTQTRNRTETMNSSPRNGPGMEQRMSNKSDEVNQGRHMNHRTSHAGREQEEPDRCTL